jgi:hypothetical protein
MCSEVLEQSQRKEYYENNIWESLYQNLSEIHDTALTSCLVLGGQVII